MTGRPLDLLDEVLQHCRFPPPGTRAVCGVSGGADSTALVLLALRARCRVTMVHVDHGLRADSGSDAEWVVALAERLGVDCVVEQVTVEDGPNLEARARARRHGVLGPDALLGHTADDQAETVLLHLLRGAGPVGLAAMDGRRRPLLGVRRAETEAVCAAAGIEPRRDPTNDDPRFRRNRVRHELLPLMADISRRDPVPLLVRLAARQAEVADLLDDLGGPVDATAVADLEAVAPLVARHVLRDWLRDETGAEHGVDTASLDRVLDVVHRRRRATEVVGGHRVARTDGRLRVEAPTSTADSEPSGRRS